MEWIYYLLEANLYLLLFYGFYKVFLQHETFSTSNRYFLLSSSLTAFVLPVLQLGFLKPAPFVDQSMLVEPILHTVNDISNGKANPLLSAAYINYLYPIYLLIAFGFAIKLIFSLTNIIRIWAKAEKKLIGKITVIALNNQTTAFSFFNLLFIHPHLAEKQTVFNHELVHIKQKHSLDILFFELLQIICWFNPIIYFLKKDIRLLHEYIADELTTSGSIRKHEYAMLLIENSFGVTPTPLTNQIFNQSILKRRINMLNKKRTTNWARLRLLLALPLTGGMLCLSTMAFTKSYGYVDLLPEKASLQNLQQKSIDEEELAKKGFYSPSYTFDKNNQYQSLEKRLIVVNGVIINDNNKYYGNSKADKILFLNIKTATEKYGAKGKYGAVEVYGTKSTLIFHPKYVIADTSKFSSPKQSQVKFPPPIVKPGKKISKALPNNQHPAVVAKGYSTKKAITLQGYPIDVNGKKVKTNTLQGYPIDANGKKVETNTLQGYPIDANGKKVETNTLQGYPIDANGKKVETNTLQGYPIDANGKKVETNTLQGYPIDANGKKVETNILQGYPIDANEKAKEVEIITAPKEKAPTKVVKGVKISPVNSTGKPVNNK